MSSLVIAMRVPKGMAAEWNDGRQTYLLIRALGYNDSLRARAKGEVSIVILFKGGDLRSQADAAGLASALGNMEGTRILGMGFKLRLVSLLPNLGIKSAMTGQPVDVLYLCDGVESYLREILEFSRQEKILTVTGNEGMVHLGVGLGIVANKRGESPIIINLRATREEGAFFGSDLLRMARVLRDDRLVKPTGLSTGPPQPATVRPQ